MRPLSLPANAYVIAVAVLPAVCLAGSETDAWQLLMRPAVRKDVDAVLTILERDSTPETGEHFGLFSSERGAANRRGFDKILQ